MIDKRFLGEWISERTEDKLDFQWSSARVVGKVYVIYERCGIPLHSSKWHTRMSEKGSVVCFINEFFGNHSFIYEFRNDEKEVLLYERGGESLYTILHRTE